MGTRSTTVVYEESSRPIINMYRQMDGYPSGHGKELADFLDGFNVVNGISSKDEGKIANGMNCLAGQLIAHFKKAPGGFYLYPVDNRDYGQDYEYHIYHIDGKIKIFIADPSKEDNIFEGTLEEFKIFCNS